MCAAAAVSSFDLLGARGYGGGTVVRLVAQRSGHFYRGYGSLSWPSALSHFRLLSNRCVYLQNRLLAKDKGERDE